MSIRFYWPCKGIVRQPCGLLTTIARVYDHFWPKWQSKTLRCPHDHRVVPARGSYDVTAMCLRATGLRFSSNLSLCGIKQYRRSHDVRKSIRWSQGLPAAAHGNGDLDIVSANDVKISVDRQKQYLSIYIRLWYRKFYICRDTCTARFYEYKKWPSYSIISSKMTCANSNVNLKQT